MAPFSLFVLFIVLQVSSVHPNSVEVLRIVHFAHPPPISAADVEALLAFLIPQIVFRAALDASPPLATPPPPPPATPPPMSPPPPPPPPPARRRRSRIHRCPYGGRRRSAEKRRAIIRWLHERFFQLRRPSPLPFHALDEDDNAMPPSHTWILYGFRGWFCINLIIFHLSLGLFISTSLLCWYVDHFVKNV